MKGMIDIHIPIKPPNDADAAYAKTHGELTDDADDTPLLKAICFTPESFADQGLDGMYAGQSIELPVGGEFKYRVFITPLKLATANVKVTNAWESDRNTQMVFKDGDNREVKRLDRGQYTTINNRDIIITIERKK